MSVTLMTVRDGKPKPIKLSIWDAFKGAPSPKPRPHRCSCCNTFHKFKGKPENNAEAEAPVVEPPAGDAAKPDEAKQEQPAFTEEEDAKIIELKTQNRDAKWADIAEALGREKHDVQNRWKEIRPLESKTGPEETKEKKQDGGKKGEEGAQAPKVSKKEKKAQAKKNKQQEQLKKDDATTGGVSESKKESPPDDQSAKPAQMNGEDKKKWEKAASKHFDRTGQRITLEQARKMAGAT